MRRRARSFGVLALVVATYGCRGSGAGQTNPDGDEPPPATGVGAWVVKNARGAANVSVEFGVNGSRVVAVSDVPKGSPVVDLAGFFVVPAFIDSHVHLAYYAVAETLPAGGIVGAVDFAAPVEHLADRFAIAVTQAGPMITPLLGYPTQSWGSGGYGLEVASPEEAAAAVDRVLDAGATFVKTPLAGTNGADDAMLAAIVDRAHARRARVAVHALTLVDATRAVASGVDILGHTPVEALPAEVTEQWGERTVVSTLAAFGGSQAASDNLRALRAAGALVLYGTDLGNTRIAGIQADEVAALVNTGFTGADIVRSATSDAASFWGFTELGSLDPEKRASFLVLDEDPNANPQTLAAPHAVVFDGKLVVGMLP